MHDLLFSNPWIDDLTGKALFDLTQVPKYQELITDLFLLMYKQKSFTEDTQSLTKKIIIDYLSSEYCLDSFSHLVVNQALRNETYVLPGIHDLLINYLHTDFIYLNELFGKMLIDIGWSEPVSNAMYDTMHDQLKQQTMSSTIYDLAVINLLQGIGQEREVVEQEMKQRIMAREKLKEQAQKHGNSS